MKGIVLSGGSGSRWLPLTKGISKQLLPVYDKPLIYYSLSVLLEAKINDILIITTEKDKSNFERLLGNGKNYGINLNYAIQKNPEGIAQSFIIANECGFLSNEENCALILGDNIFYGVNFSKKLKEAKNISEEGKSVIFGINVKEEEANRYGIVEIDENNNIKSIEEKPKIPKSNICVSGLYFYPKGIVEISKKIKPSKRGELEITSVNNEYLEKKALELIKLEDFMWADCGTFDGLSEASEYVKAIEKRHGKLISCLEEIAYNNGWISNETLLQSAKEYEKNEYGEYLMKLYIKSTKK